MKPKFEVRSSRFKVQSSKFEVSATLYPPSSILVFILALALGLLSGCLSRPSLNPQSFNFSVPPITSAAPAANGRVLGIRRLTIAAPFRDQSFVYRTGAFSYERDPYAQFLVPPEEGLVAPVRAYFRNSGLFSGVAEPGSALKPGVLVEISVPQLYGDFQNRAAPGAVLAMRFIFFDAPNGVAGKVLLQKDYSRRIRLKTRTAAVLMAGWNEALKEILAEAASEFKQAGKP